MTQRPKQRSLHVRRYIVRAYGFINTEVQASTTAGAKYQAFKLAREAGYFNDRKTGFREFLTQGVTAREISR